MTMMLQDKIAATLGYLIMMICVIAGAVALVKALWKNGSKP